MKCFTCKKKFTNRHVIYILKEYQTYTMSKGAQTWIPVQVEDITSNGKWLCGSCYHSRHKYPAYYRFHKTDLKNYKKILILIGLNEK